jgi:hypothetical protein
MLDGRKHTNPYHPDVVLFLALIPFISAFNYYLTYSNIKFNGFLLLTFTIDTVQGYLAWWAVRSIIIYLDKKWPYETGGYKRIISQLVMTTFVGLFIITVLTELVSWIAKGKPAAINFYSIDLFIISIWFFVINGIYVGLHFYNLWQKSEEARKEEARLKSDGFLAKQGKQELRLPFEEIAGFLVDGEYPAVTLLSGKKYYIDKSLDKVENELPSSYFFRLNRQVILHRQLISGFKRIENGKIVVLTKNKETFPAEIQVSRTKAPAFKTWFRPE